MNQVIEGVRWTVHDLEVLPENEWTRYEYLTDVSRLGIRI